MKPTLLNFEELFRRKIRTIEDFISGAFPKSRSLAVAIDVNGGIPQLIVRANAKRTKILIQNLGANTIFLGGGLDLTALNGFQVLTNQTFIDDINPFTGEWWGIALAGPNDVRVKEEYRESA